VFGAFGAFGVLMIQRHAFLGVSDILQGKGRQRLQIVFKATS
jgi:hypothetical protein